ncbi:hypothetical protein Patl1_17662 [Pistacia atlantica]|uniref:Uncharacterized protein n=1 Tax=Pistacia atlantica TaxID=434234 RepID=A0ACC1C309_9ROSI|nr:hypothetical protein Patl1_17662 [Pistacia atlantica]
MVFHPSSKDYVASVPALRGKCIQRRANVFCRVVRYGYTYVRCYLRVLMVKLKDFIEKIIFYLMEIWLLAPEDNENETQDEDVAPQKMMGMKFRRRSVTRNPQRERWKQWTRHGMLVLFTCFVRMG